MKMISLLLLISISTVYAAPQKKVPAKAKKTTATAVATPTPAPSATPVPEAAIAEPAPTPIPWKLSYFGSYTGPRLSNLNFAKTQGPLDANSSYTSWGHSLKLGYAISKDVVIGTQVRPTTPFDPTQTLSWSNLRLYFSWNHMIDTSDVDMQGVLDFEVPSSTDSKNKGMIMAFNIKNNWTFKTSLRNWGFSALTLLRPMFYNSPTANKDIYFAIDPSAELTISADWALELGGNLEVSHIYNNTYFDFRQQGGDYFTAGIQYTINSHIQVIPGFQFFTEDFSVPVITFGLSAAL